MPENFEQPKQDQNIPSPIDRVTKLRSLHNQLSGKYDSNLSRELYEGKKQLTTDVTQILDDSILEPQEKIQLIKDLAPLVEWGYVPAKFGASEEERAEATQRKIAAETRIDALNRFFDSIRPEDFSDGNIQYFLSHSRQFPGSIAHRTINLIKLMDPERALQFIPFIDEFTIPEVISDWSPTASLPIVRDMMEKNLESDTHKEKSGSIQNNYKNVITSISKWPQEQQQPIIEEIFENRWNNYIHAKSLFALMRSWPVNKAMPYVIKALQYQKKGYVSEDRYTCVAEALSNWPEDQIEAVLSREENLTWIDARASSFGSAEEEKEGELNQFYLNILRNRTEPITGGMKLRLKEGLGWKHQQGSSVVSVLKNHPELFDELASDLFLSPGDSAASYAIETLQLLSCDKQYEFIEAIANGFSRYWGHEKNNGLDRLKTLVSEFDAEHRIMLISNLLQREKSVWKGNNIRQDWENGFALLNTESVISDPVIVKNILRHSIIRPDFSLGRRADELVKKIERNEETERLIIEVAGDAIVQKFNSLNQQTARDVLEIASKYNLGLSAFKDKLPICFQSFVESFGIADTENLCQFVEKNFEYVSFLATSPNEHSKITPEDLLVLPSLCLSLLEAEKVIRAGISLPEVKTEEDFKNLFKTLAETDRNWQDEQNISNPFRAGAEIFGYRRMFDYLRRDGLSLHDNLHAFEEIVALYKVSGLGSNEFYGQVLQQVRMDDREYQEGTAHHHLNAIAQAVNKNVAEIIARVQDYREIESLQELAATFNTPQAVFASWINLKRYSELEQLLGQTEVFDELKELKAEGKEKLYRYVETLAFHPDSKVNMSAVIQFWRDPESFLAAEASHTPYEVHDRKKPSNYLNMPNLDLTALELRDALVEGKMDGLSAFTPLEIRYTIPLEDSKAEPLPDLVIKALGSHKKGVEGAARNSRKLFSELGILLKQYGVSVVDYVQGKVLPEGVNLSQDIEALLYNRDFGMERPFVKTREFVARISQKSDPEGAIAGDDTVNCMPFGDGKNTVYTFNPNTSQFVIRVVKGDDKERTIAQSVLTKDMDIKILVPDVISKLQQEGGHLDDILPADILADAPVYAACDNVEVAPNYSDERHQQIIEAIFRDFFREYMSRYAKIEGLNPKKVPIGQGYTDALSQLPTEVNTFAPQAPVSYSDKTGSSVYMLDLESNAKMDLIWQKQVRETKVKKQTEPSLPKMKGLGYLTFEDTLKVAYLEGKAYSDNQSLMQFLFNMENGLIAKDINNAAKERPNMSVKYTDESGRMRGYMLAWEGRLLDENVEYNAGEYFNQPCVYIIDIATDQENRMAGGRLIQGFAELYKQNYLDKGNAMPIFAQARESTSYQIVKRQLDKLGKDAGYNFELIELPTYEVGEDTMHPIIIRPVSKKKQ